MNGNLETRVSALETQMQEIRDLLQQTVQLQQQTTVNLSVLTQAQERTQQQLNQTQAIANSNARSVFAWEALIEQNRVEAEEERSTLLVSINELKQASKENIQQHFAFMQRFDETLAEIRQIWQRVDG